MSDSTEPASEDPAEWGASTCARCGGEFILQLHGAETGKTCPHCGAPTNLSTSKRDTPGEFALLSPRRGRRTRSRRKRKVLSEEDLAWEAGDEVAPEKLGQVSEYLTASPDRPGKLRLKRVRRKKLPTRLEKLSAKVGVWTIAAVVAGTGILIYVALRTLFVVAATDTDPSQQQAPPPDLGPDPATLDAAGLPTIVTAEEKAACIAVGNAFYAASSVEEKLPHVRQPERVRPLMEAWYASHGDGAGGEPIAEVLFQKKFTLGERRFIQLAVGFGSGAQRIIVFEQGDDASLRLDWEVSVGYQPMPLAEFKATRPTAATPFRVKVKKGDEYRAPFEDRERYQSLRLSYPGDRGFQLTAYVKRDAPWAAALIANFEFNQAPSVILNLRFPEGATSDSPVEAVEMVHDSWFY